MCISGTEPSSVIILAKKNGLKIESYNPKVPKQAETKRGDAINPQNYNFDQF